MPTGRQGLPGDVAVIKAGLTLGDHCAREFEESLAPPMRIDANRPILPAASRRDGRTGSSFATDFAAPASGDVPAASTGAARSLSPVDGLFALQEVPEDALAGRRRAIRRGSDLLDRLDELRVALLSGRLSANQLHELTRLAATERTRVDDPLLSAVLEEIDLRAQVELAKLAVGLR